MRLNMTLRGPFAFSVLLALSWVTLTAASSKLPSNFKRCHREDPRLNQCLRDAVGDAFRKMKDGIPSLGVLPTDPLKVNEIKIDQGQGPVSLNMHLTDIVIKGLANTKMLNYSALLDQGVLDTASITPVVTVDFTHELNGRILVLPVRGAGPGRMTLNDLITNHYLKFDRKKRKDGKAYWSITDYQVRFETKSISMDFKGLFGTSGDSRLGDQLNSFVKQNSRLMFDELRPAFEDAFSAVFKGYTIRIFDKVPVDDIFLPGKGP